MSEGKEKGSSNKKTMKPDSKITMTIKKGLTMKTDNKLRMTLKASYDKKRNRDK